MKRNTTHNKKKSCLSTPFRITTVLSDTGPINRTASLVDGNLEYSADCETFEGNLEVLECLGLTELQKWLDSGDPEFAVVLGYPQQDGQSIQSVDIIGPRPSTRSSSPKIKRSPDSLMQFMRNEVSLVVFDLLGISDIPETAWKHLCAVDPQLNSVGYIATHSPYSYIRDAATGEMLTAQNGCRFYCLATKWSNVKSYGEKFSRLSWIRGYGHLELTETGEYLIKQIVDADAFQPGHTACEAVKMGHGLIQERPNSIIRDGSFLDTRKLRKLDDIEEYVYMLEVKEAMRSLQRSVFPHDGQQKHGTG